MKKAIFLLLLLCGCHRAPYENGEILGADDFVMDSYVVREEPATEGEQGESFVTVAGAVMKKGIISVEGRYHPLREVLVQAGGLTSFASQNKIYIFRECGGRPRVYEVKWEHLVKLPQMSLLTIPGDIIFVGTKPLYRWVADE